MGALTEGTTQLTLHHQLLADAFRRGRVVPFLGAGVNLCDRPQGVAWRPEEKTFLPSGAELARYLAEKFFYPGRQRCSLAEIDDLAQKRGTDETDRQVEKGVKAEMESRCLRPDPDLDLLRVSQFGATMLEAGPIYDELHALFGRDVPPTSAHRFLASLPPPDPKLCRPEDRHLLIVTTNYDDLMECALGEGNYDLVFYVPDEQPRPRFWRRTPGEPVVPIENPNAHPYVFFEQRPVVLKIHGTVDRADQKREGFVITEDQYIEYLAEEPLDNLLPPALVGKMRDLHHLLFLGYSLRDWNFRVFFRRLKRNSKRYKAWAVLLPSDQTEKQAEKQFWMKNGVDIIEQPLGSYVRDLAAEL
jgi:hypothetical protein